MKSILSNGIWANGLFMAGGLAVRVSGTRAFAVNRAVCAYGMLYFAGDSLHQVLVKRSWLYVPHHICGAYIFYQLATVVPEAKVLGNYAAILVAIEYSGLITNLRHVLKREHRLPWKLDAFLFGNYTLVRVVAFPWFISTYVEDVGLQRASWAIYTMSAYWSGKWAKGLWDRRPNKKW